MSGTEESGFKQTLCILPTFAALRNLCFQTTLTCMMMMLAVPVSGLIGMMNLHMKAILKIS
jgi:hypothetical protein